MTIILPGIDSCSSDSSPWVDDGVDLRGRRLGITLLSGELRDLVNVGDGQRQSVGGDSNIEPARISLGMTLTIVMLFL